MKKLILFIILLSCGIKSGYVYDLKVQSLGEGVIIEKDYDPPYTTRESRQVAYGTDKNGFTKYRTEYYTQHHPADYALLIQDDDSITGQKNLI